jgi:uncharacterized protein (TIGR00369 family)
LHSQCFACGQCADGLGLRFETSGSDEVIALWYCSNEYQGYPGIVHGGIVATILDSAMTNCLLLRGIPAVTAEMHIRYRKPLVVGAEAKITATLVGRRANLFELKAEVAQGEVTVATATARFVKASVWLENGNA